MNKQGQDIIKVDGVSLGLNVYVGR